MTNTLRMLSAIAAMSVGLAVSAQDYPARPIRILVPAAPGGVTDIAARLIGQRLTQAWGQQVVVENRAGAGGSIGVAVAATAAPDGYTLLMTTSGEMTINPLIYPKLQYNPVQDFAPIVMTTITPLMWVANSQAPINSLKDLIATAKSRPGTLPWASPGTGSTNHLTGEWFAAETGISLVHVPYKGGAPAAAAIAGGEVPVGLVAISSAQPHIKSGKMKVLGLTTIKRAAIAPEWPTVADAGVKNFDASIWVGLFAPAATPRDVILKVNREVNRALQASDLLEKFAAFGAEAVGGTPEDLMTRMKADAAVFARVAQQAKIKLD